MHTCIQCIYKLHMYIRVHMHIHVHTLHMHATHMHIYTHVYMYMYMCTYTQHLHMFACMHTYTPHTCTPHTCTCTLHTCHTHVHTCASTGMQVSTLVRLQANHLAANSLLRPPKLNWPCGKYVHCSLLVWGPFTPAFVLSSLGSQGT